MRTHTKKKLICRSKSYVSLSASLILLHLNFRLARLENRTSKRIWIRQSGFGEDYWIQLEKLSATNFSWEDPYGQRFIDVKVDRDSPGTWKADLELAETFSVELQMTLQVAEAGDIKVIRFTDNPTLVNSKESTSGAASGNSNMQGKTQNNVTPLEFILELGVVGLSIVDHRPKELCYLHLEKVFISYSTGFDNGTTTR